MTLFQDLAGFFGVPIENLGHLIGGTGVFLGALVALYSAIVITGRYYRSQKQEWNAQRERRVAETFHQFHEQLWETEQIVKVRRCIVNDQEYRDILEPVLAARNANERNVLSKQENDVLESLDRYLATVLRIKFFLGRETLDKAEIEVWNRLLWQNFGDRVKHDRKELQTYIERNWDKDLLDKPNFVQRISGFMARARKRLEKKAKAP